MITKLPLLILANHLGGPSGSERRYIKPIDRQTDTYMRNDQKCMCGIKLHE